MFSLPVPISATVLVQSLNCMKAARERLRLLEGKHKTMEEKIEELRLVNHANWILIDRFNMSEKEAHRYIEKQAMNHCCSCREIALGIMKTLD